MTIVEQEGIHTETVWATPTHALIPDVYFSQEWLPPMLGGYQGGERVKVEIGKSPFFRPDRVFGDWDRWQSKLRGMDYWLELNEPPVHRLKMKEDLSGKPAGYEAANAALLREKLISEQEMKLLVDFSLEPNNPMGMRRMAGGIAGSLTTRDAVKTELAVNKLEAKWRKIRQNISFGNTQGVDPLKDLSARETDTHKRTEMLRIVHSRNTALANLMLQKREALLQAVSYDSRSYKERVLGSTGYDVAEIDFEKLFEWVTAAWRNIGSKWIDISGRTSAVNEDFLWKLGERFQTEPLTELIRVKKTKSVARCYHPLPPYDVYATFDDEKNFEGKRTKLHEVGHAQHSTNIDEQLPYTLRFADPVWSESMAIYHDGIAHVPGIILRENSRYSERDLEQARLLRALGSMASSIIGVHWEQWFYDTESNVNPHSASDYYTSSMNAVNGRIDSPLQWANDFYLGEYPWYGVNYTVAYMVVEQLRAYATTRFGGPYTPEAIWWLHETCWWPGGALSWKDLIQHATGEEFTPTYFFNALKKADLYSANEINM